MEWMQLNAGLTTQMLLSLFRVKGIVHWGIAGNANEDLQIGDVTIPEYWAHVSLWNWQVVQIWCTQKRAHVMVVQDFDLWC